MQKRNSILLTLILVSLLTGCTNSSDKPNNEHSKVDTSDSVNGQSNTQTDTLALDTILFPDASTFKARLLTTGTFHDQEVWDGVEKEKWFGLFKNKNGYYIDQTRIKTKRVFDGIVDENEKDKSGWEVFTENKDSSIILITGVSDLSKHKVQEVVLTKEIVYPGDTISFIFHGSEYKLYATGAKAKVQKEPEWFNIRNYKLYLTSTKEGRTLTELLVAQPAFDDEMINLVFAGDIDDDGLLDLIIDTSADYNTTSPTIFMSRPAGNRNLLVPIAGHMSSGC
jgi:hypothetical protein